MSVGKESAQRKIYLQDDRQMLPTFAGKMECGGDAQLEALGYYAQYLSVQHLFGDEISLKVQQEVTEDHKDNLKYRWAQIVANTYGLLPATSQNESTGSVDVSFLLPIIYGSLMSRAWKQPQSNSELGGSGSPLARLAGLLNTLQGKFNNFGDISVEDSWELVNDAAKQLWGSTCIEEAEEDYKHEDAWCNKIQKIETVPNSIKLALWDFHRLRRSLLDTLNESPLVIFDPRSTAITGAFLPLPVTAVPAGEYGEPPEGWEMIFGYQDPDIPQAKWWWAAIPEQWPIDSDQAFTLKERKAWGAIIGYHAPLAKLMMNGRKHSTILGPELIFMEQYLKAKRGIDIVIEPPFEFPRESDDIGIYYTLTDKKQAMCDICKEILVKPEGHYLSAWVLRYNAQNAQVAIDAYGGGTLGYLAFIKDWSPWVLCDKHYLQIRAKTNSLPTGSH